MISIDNLPHPQNLSYPNYCVSGFFRSREEAAEAVQALEEDGFSDDDFCVFEGESGLKALDFTGQEHGGFEFIKRKFMQFFEVAEWVLRQEADQELRAGAVMVLADTENKEYKDQIVNCFRQHGAYDIRFFDPYYVEEVEN